MKFITPIILTFLLLNGERPILRGKSKSKNDIYKIILITRLAEPEKDPETGEVDTTEIPGQINTLTIKKLKEPLKALAAFYSAIGGTMCDGKHCDLTTALGLGQQGSERHKNLIRKYFPNDKIAELVLRQDCYLRPSGASTFSDYEFLTITDKGDTVTVDYNLVNYEHGDIEWTIGPDIYLFKENKFKKIKRNVWTSVDE